MLELLLILNIVFIFGTIFGSFIGVIVDRLYREEQFLKGSSYCENCKTPLKWLDMIPVVSYLLLRGKCRYCKKSLSPSLPIIELTTGLVFAVIFYISFVNYNDQLVLTLTNVLRFLFLVSTIGLLEIIFFMDAKYMAIPMIPLYLILPIYLLYTFFVSKNLVINLEYSIYGALIMFIFFAGIHFASKGQMMGAGDIYLSSVLGFILGLDLSVLMWLLSFMIGAMYGGYLMIAQGAGLKKQVPFGPFLIIGFIISWSMGSAILSIYYSFF
jgi:leader peptidase (prepilin peptidase)/N-methyltransferase